MIFGNRKILFVKNVSLEFYLECGYIDLSDESDNSVFARDFYLRI